MRNPSLDKTAQELLLGAERASSPQNVVSSVAGSPLTHLQVPFSSLLKPIHEGKEPLLEEINELKINLEKMVKI